ncbi:hypothetical protein [Streptomyces sp. PsTaAH-124]|uniref:hypothetical protein n=1 Tax=Streptomyces sp. PsTaAH-124 TaxID=1157638 RepID=UPI001319C573|nr:hypothetical protein [Streptomyces sp. PsTaAH-124]
MHRSGRGAVDPAAEVSGGPARRVTVRTGMSRVRRCPGAPLEHRPDRGREDAEARVPHPGDPRDLLPHPAAPPVRRGRAASAAL